MNLLHGIALFAALSAPPAGGPVTSIVYEDLKPGQRFEITAGDQVFRGELLDPNSGECLVTTGSSLWTSGPRQHIWLLGSTQGAQPGSGGLTLILMHRVTVGQRMEVGQGDLQAGHRLITAPVSLIRLLSAEVPVERTAQQ